LPGIPAPASSNKRSVTADTRASFHFEFHTDGLFFHTRNRPVKHFDQPRGFAPKIRSRRASLSVISREIDAGATRAPSGEDT
jgi:hypothetical protein